MNTRHTPDFDTTIQGISCGIKVLNYKRYAPHHDKFTAPSAEDAYGGVDFDYLVLDRRGYEAPWLADKVTDDDERRFIREYEG